jgi:hypothetical protein
MHHYSSQNQEELTLAKQSSSMVPKASNVKSSKASLPIKIAVYRDGVKQAYRLITKEQMMRRRVDSSSTKMAGLVNYESNMETDAGRKPLDKASMVADSRREMMRQSS